MHSGACASGDPYSAKAGADVLAAGGNAVDAAVAAGLMACVTLPSMTSLAGGGIMTLLVDGRTTVCDHFGAVPGIGLDRRGPRHLDLVQVDFDGIKVDFRVRAPSVAVPGTVAGLWEVHLRHGRMPLAEVAAPAIRVAREGFAIQAGQHKAFLLLEEIFRMTPEAWGLVSNGDEIARPGDVLYNPDLAETLSRLVEEGPVPFYEGDLAARIVEAAEGWVTREDLAAYRPLFREPLEATYRQWTLHVPAMPSVTGAMVLKGLDHLERGGPLGRPLATEDWGRVADALRVAAATRTEEYERRLFEDGYLQGLLARCPGGSTMHCSTADRDGNLVAYTGTVGEGSGLVARGTGVILNNFLGEEDILPAGGLGAAGKRMMTAMCPIVMHDGVDRWVALGSAGSARIKSAILQLVVHLVDGGMPPRDAVRTPRIHVEGDLLYIEGWGRTLQDVLALQTLSPSTRTSWDCGFFFGGAQVVERSAQGFSTGADEERRGCAGFVA